MGDDTQATLDRIEHLLQRLADVTAEADRIRDELVQLARLRRVERRESVRKAHPSRTTCRIYSSDNAVRGQVESGVPVRNRPGRSDYGAAEILCCCRNCSTEFSVKQIVASGSKP
jgi:hypothetical protein